MKKLIVIVCFLISFTSYSQEKRLALVIGNSTYEHGGELRNPVNDAVAMNKALSQFGFEVMEFFNLSQKEMKRAIDEFGMKLKSYDVGLFFYAGHGIQANGNNYLIPIEANLSIEQDVEYDCVRADRILAKMDASGANVNLVILDACRNNPFERSWTRSTGGKGLAFMNAPSGTLIAYATAPGSTASDGTGRNGLYTESILESMQISGITILQMFQNVRLLVSQRSNNQQTPWESTSLIGDFYFGSLSQSLSLTETSDKSSNSIDMASKGNFIDIRDKEDYSWVRIGEQIWMSENLNYYTSTGSSCYGNKASNCDIYGRLYDWETAKKVCPDGWHLPSDAEWTELTDYFGGKKIAGGKLKETSTTHWNSPNVGATNSNGFTALPGGYRDTNGSFYYLGSHAYFWTATKTSGSGAWRRDLCYDYVEVSRRGNYKNSGRSVRCVGN